MRDTWLWPCIRIINQLCKQHPKNVIKLSLAQARKMFMNTSETHKKAMDIEEQHNFKITLLRWSGMNYSRRLCKISRDDVKSEIGVARNPCTQSTSDIAGLAWTPLRCVWSTLLCNSSQHSEQHCGCICRSSAPLRMEELRSCKIAKEYRKVTKARLFLIWQDLCVTCFWNALYKFKGMFPT